MSLTLLVLLVPIVILAVAGFVAVRLIGGQNKAAEIGAAQAGELRARMARGIPARATVVQSQTIVAMPGRGAAAIQLRLEAESPSGERYPVTAKWEVDLLSLARLQPGQVLAITIDPENRTWIYPAEAWARIYGDGR